MRANTLSGGTPRQGSGSKEAPVQQLMVVSDDEFMVDDDPIQVSETPDLSLVEADPDGLPPELAWQERALCAQTDPEAFFPEKGGSTREAKRVCMSCDVRSECLEYALAKDERFGIWGGLSERERRRVKKQAV
jgi:WhiB family transcriptional regulator, redox-sensing transcriptional regulator